MKNPLKILSAMLAFVKITRDPNKLNEVFSLNENTLDRAIQGRLRDHFSTFPGGAEALAARKRLPRLDVKELRKMPEGSFGRAFAEHMAANGLDPAAIPTLPDSDELEFINAHLYETHDIWHAVTGFNTDVAGELGLQAFYLAQFPGNLPPAILAAGLLNTGFFRMDTRDARMDAVAEGWLMGRRAKMLFGADWASMWELPVAEVRARFGIDPRGAQATLEPVLPGLSPLRSLPMTA